MKMDPLPGLISNIIGIIRQKFLPLILMLAVGEIAIWLSGKATFWLMLLLVVVVAIAAIFGAIVRIWLEGRHKE
jgi:hypothetical protein